MPKRKHSHKEDIDRYKNKIKRLERKIRERNSKNASEPERDPETEEAAVTCFDNDIEADTPALRPDDWLLQWPEDQATEKCTNSPLNNTSEPGPSTSAEIPLEEQATDQNTDLDTDILEILGDDPTCDEKYGPEIRTELANRLLHLTKEGLNKENRKTLITKYQVPANCIQIEAPKLNLEIKAAITEAAIKRDKGIEHKQRQMSSAIACLSAIINTEINSKTKNNDMLQKFMDVSRILCDLQHADSVTRRNFILFALKNDIKEHLKNTKIDTYLFGENLADTLKTAKAVNKSGTELKAEINVKASTKYKGPTQRPLNRKAPPQARRQPAGPAYPAPRSREPAAVRAPYHPPAQPPHQQPPHASSRTSSQPQHGTYPRRRF